MSDTYAKVKSALSDLLLLADRDALAAHLARMLLSRGRMARRLADLYMRGKDASRLQLLREIAELTTDPTDVNRTREMEEPDALLQDLQNGVAIYGLFTAEIGIGQSARRSARAFQTTDTPHSRHNIHDFANFVNNISFPVSPTLRSQYNTILMHLNADTLLVTVPRLPLSMLARRRRIGFWHWELPVFPASWQPAFDYVDEVWAPSAYVADTLRAASSHPIRIVPHAVEGSGLAQDQCRADLGLPASPLIFLTVFDSNSYLERKNPIGVVRAFQDAFPAGRAKDVVLVVKYHGRGNRGAAFDELARLAAADPRIVLIDALFSEEDVRKLQSACDVYVSMHRAEGFGLNIIECMVEGKLAIATEFSGNLDFMTKQNSVLLPYAMRKVGPGEYLHGEGQWWADPDHEAAVEAMRWAATSSTEVAARSARAQSDIEANYSFQRVGQISVAALRAA